MHKNEPKAEHHSVFESIPVKSESKLLKSYGRFTITDILTMVSYNPSIIRFDWNSELQHIFVEFDPLLPIFPLYAPMAYNPSSQQILTYGAKKNEGYIWDNTKHGIHYTNPVEAVYKNPKKVLSSKAFIELENGVQIYPTHMLGQLSPELIERMQNKKPDTFKWVKFD